MRYDKPELGDVLALKCRRPGKVICVENRWFDADQYTVRYLDGTEEVVTGCVIIGIEDGESELITDGREHDGNK